MDWLKWILVVHVMYRPSLCTVVKPLYHEYSKEIYSMPIADGAKRIDDGALFGYSVSYEPSQKRMIIGAPKADNMFGKVYSCEVKVDASCQALNVSDTDSKMPTQNSWFGATVKAWDSHVVACAPRRYEWSAVKEKAGTFSKCYHQQNLKQDALSVMPVSESMILESNKKYFGKVNYDLNEYMMRTFGWSIDVVPETNTVLIGGPGMTTGRVIKYQINDYTGAIKQNLLQFEKNTVMFKFGYGIASGKFITKKNVHVISSPYGVVGQGKLLFFNEKDIVSDVWQDDDNVGTIFGSALCFVNLGKPTQHLLVGAPAFAPTTASTSSDSKHSKSNEIPFDTGAVYLFVYDNLSIKLVKMIKGQQNGGYFGSAIVNVGDLNGDHMDDVAIAAPYEDDGQGAVYIYSGADLLRDKQPTWHQKIKAEGKYLGLSLAVLQDNDENGCNELAIGMPGANKVMVVRCMATVNTSLHLNLPTSPFYDYTHIILTTTFPEGVVRDILKPQNIHVSPVVPEISFMSLCLIEIGNRWQLAKAALDGFPRITDKTSQYFTFTPCLHVSFPEKPETVNTSISVTIQLYHPNATIDFLDSHEYKYQAVLKKDIEKYCNDVKILLPMDGDYDQPIKFNMTSKLLVDPMEIKTFDGGRVMLSETSQLWTHGEVMAPGSDISVNITSTMQDGYKIGSKSSEQVTLVMTNAHSVAYDSCMRVRFDGGGVMVKRLPESCAPDGAKSLCAPPEPLHAGSSWNATLELDTTAMTSNSERVDIVVEVFNRCSDVTGKVVKQSITLTSNPSAISVRGFSNTGLFMNLTRSDLKSETRIDHIYSIMNSGYSTWENIKCVITVPSYVNAQAMVVDTSTECMKEDETHIKCNVKKVKGNKKVDIKVGMTILPHSQVTDQISKNSTANIVTFIDLQLENKTIFEQLTTVVTLKVLIPLWIIIAASVVGLLLLCLIIFALYECGCLRRKNKDKLNELKTDIKRQTVLRNSMRLRQSLIDAVAIQHSKMHKSERRLLDLSEEDLAEDRRVVVDDDDYDDEGQGSSTVTRADIH